MRRAAIPNGMVTTSRKQTRAAKQYAIAIQSPANTNQITLSTSLMGQNGIQERDAVASAARRPPASAHHPGGVGTPKCRGAVADHPSGTGPDDHRCSPPPRAHPPDSQTEPRTTPFRCGSSSGRPPRGSSSRGASSPPRSASSRAVDVDGEEVEVPFRSPADGGLERDAVALAGIGVADVPRAAVDLRVALVPVLRDHDAVDHAAWIAEQVARLEGAGHHPELELPVDHEGLDGRDAR